MAWQDNITSGVVASRPAASAVINGALYFATDEEKIYQSDGVSTWTLILTGGGASAAWTLDATKTATGVETALTFTGLSAYSEIMVYQDLLDLATSGTGALQVSEDNGATYETASGYYVGVAGGTGAESNRANVPLNATSSTSPRSGMVHIINWNLTDDKLFHIIGGTFSETFRIARNGVACDALQVVGSNGGNMNSGSIHVYGKTL